MVTPRKIMAFVGIILLLLLFISLFFPEGEQRISDQTVLKFPSVRDIFSKQKVEYADISSIVSSGVASNDSLTEQTTETKNNLVSKKVQTDTVKVPSEELLLAIQPIEYPEDNYSVLYPFFKDLNRINQIQHPVRIMHYGDSQIEGDRITSYIRDQLQSRFGGSGPGLLPVVQPYGQFSMEQDVSENWNRYTVFGKKDKSIFHNRYGVLASFCRFSPSQSPVDNNTFEAWFNAQIGPKSYPTAKKFNRFKIFYGYNKKPFLIQCNIGDEIIDVDMIPVANHMQTLEWQFVKTPDKISVELKGEDSPDIYGLSFESNQGVIVDNIPLRGSSGLIFTKMDKDLLKTMYSQLNVKLIILQFGGNAVPYISDNYERYGLLFYNQLNRLKTLLPGVPILIVGVADMSVKDHNQYKTYPVLPRVRDALKEAAFKAGCAYWDMYEAMGGENSMPSWVNAEPPLASTDYVHFNHKGAKLIAEMFYNALMLEYNLYMEKKKPVNLASNY